MNLIDELRWRGMVQDMTPETDTQFNAPTTVYIGFDPTAESLHIGSLATIMLMVQLQRHGHTPIVVVGGATGMVGDPSGKKSERPMLSDDVLQRNVAGISSQLGRFVRFDGANAAKVLNNYDWFSHMNLLDFLRDVGKHASTSAMLAKDSVKSRLDDGISFTEFSYQLLQGYDFLHLYQHHGVRVQMGGSDQWGNMTAGTDLIRRKLGQKAYALTMPLLTKPDGSKFGKSEGGNVWLSADLTKPYDFYQYWLGVSDDEAPKLLRLFTLLPEEEINTLIERHHIDPSFHHMQRVLALDITDLVHGKEECEKAQTASRWLYRQVTSEMLHDVMVEELEYLAEIIQSFNVTDAKTVGELLANETCNICSSKSDAKRLIEQKGIRINGQLMVDNTLPAPVHGYFLVERGKKKFIIKTT